MNWVGGPRQRIKIKNEKRIQREFFEKQRRLQRVASVKKKQESKTDQSEISQDLMFLYPIGSNFMSGNANRASNQVNYVDLSKPKRPQIFRNARLGSSSHDKSRSILDFNTPADDVNRSKRAKKYLNDSHDTPKTMSVVEKHIQMNIARSRSLQESQGSKLPLQPIKRKLGDSDNNVELDTSRGRIISEENERNFGFDLFVKKPMEVINDDTSKSGKDDFKGLKPNTSYNIMDIASRNFPKTSDAGVSEKTTETDTNHWMRHKSTKEDMIWDLASKNGQTEPQNDQKSQNSRFDTSRLFSQNKSFFPKKAPFEGGYKHTSVSRQSVSALSNGRYKHAVVSRQDIQDIKNVQNVIHGPRFSTPNVMVSRKRCNGNEKIGPWPFINGEHNQQQNVDRDTENSSLYCPAECYFDLFQTIPTADKGTDRITTIKQEPVPHDEMDPVKDGWTNSEINNQAYESMYQSRYNDDTNTLPTVCKSKVSASRYASLLQNMNSGSANSSSISMRSYGSFCPGRNEANTSSVSAKSYESLGFPVEMSIYDKVNGPSKGDDDSEEENMRQEIYKQKHVYTGPIDTRSSKKKLCYPGSCVDEMDIEDGMGQLREGTRGACEEYRRSSEDLPEMGERNLYYGALRKALTAKKTKGWRTASNGIIESKLSASQNETMAEVMGMYENSDGSSPHSLESKSAGDMEQTSADDIDEEAAKLDNNTEDNPQWLPPKDDSVVPSLSTPQMNNFPEEDTNSAEKHPEENQNDTNDNKILFSIDKYTQTIDDKSSKDVMWGCGEGAEKTPVISTEAEKCNSSCPFCKCVFNPSECHKSDGSTPVTGMEKEEVSTSDKEVTKSAAIDKTGDSFWDFLNSVNMNGQDGTKASPYKSSTPPELKNTAGNNSETTVENSYTDNGSLEPQNNRIQTRSRTAKPLK